MADKKPAKQLRFPLIMAITLSLMGVSIIAVAAILPQLQKDRTKRTGFFSRSTISRMKTNGCRSLSAS